MKIFKDTSRKWRMSVACVGLASVLPFLFKWAGIANEIQMVVLGAIIALPTSYSLSNVIEKKANK